MIIDETQSQAISFEVQLTQKDLIEYSFYVILRRPLIVAIFIFYLLYLGYDIVMAICNSTPVLIPLSIFIFFLFLIPALIYWRGIRSFKNNLYLQEKTSYTIDKKTVSVKGESFNSIYNIDNTNKLKESDGYFYIFVQRYAANIIPKRCLSAQQIEFIRTMLKN